MRVQILAKEANFKNSFTLLLEPLAAAGSFTKILTLALHQAIWSCFR